MSMIPDDTPGEVPPWKVHGDQIRTETTLGPGMAGLRTEHVIPYTITEGPARGHSGAVRLADDDAHAEGAKQAIMADAARVHAIAKLAHPGA